MQKPDNSKLVIYFNGEPIEVTRNDNLDFPKDLIQCTERSDSVELKLDVIGFQEWYYKKLDNHLYQ